MEEFKREMKTLTVRLKEAENRAEQAEKSVKRLQKEVDRLEGASYPLIPYSPPLDYDDLVRFLYDSLLVSVSSCDRGRSWTLVLCAKVLSFLFPPSLSINMLSWAFPYFLKPCIIITIILNWPDSL